MTMDGDVPTPRVGVLFDSISENTGDIAIGIAAVQEFARHGIDDVRIVDPFASHADVDALLVGGGELIRPLGDPFYDRFREPAAMVLNAVGVWEEAADLEYLADYAVVSARSSVEAERLRRFLPEVQVLPCTTTTLESPRYQIEGVEPGETVVGIHVVPHTLSLVPDIVAIVDSIPHKKVFIPFTHYNFDDSFMSALPFDRTNAVQLPRLGPLELHSVLGQMSYVVVSSLHASIFAYSQHVPFASAHQEKVQNYFADRDLAHLVFGSGKELRSTIDLIETGRVNLRRPVAADRAAVHGAYARFAALARERASLGSGTSRHGNEPATSQASDLLTAQLSHVIYNRDATISNLMRRSLCAEAEAEKWHAEADRRAAQAAMWREAHQRQSARLRQIERFIPKVVLRQLRRRASPIGPE